MEIVHQNLSFSSFESSSPKNNVEQQKFLNNFLAFLEIKKEDIPEILIFIKELKLQKQFARNNQYKFDLLTKKEREVLTLVAKGNTTKKVADELFVETCTISTHRKKIKQKLETQCVLEWKKFYETFKNTY